MTPNPILTDDFKPSPLWWEDAPLMPAPGAVPSEADAVVIGAGYSGLMAARTMARGGLKVVLLEAGDPGIGAASRNHGHYGGIGKLPRGLTGHVGATVAGRIREDAVRARHFLADLIREEKLDVDRQERGRFMGAHSPAAYETYARNLDVYRKELGLTVHMVPQAEQRREIGSDFYFGGLVTEEAGALQPAKMLREMRRLAEKAGVTICGNAAVTGIEHTQGGGFVLHSARGEISCKTVALLTNAYTGRLNAHIRRRIVPLNAYMIATEPLPLSLAEEVLPTNRTGGDTKRTLYAFRRSPDGRRIVFAGRAKFGPMPEADAAPILHRFMAGVWPQLAQTRISHCWTGLVAFTWDHLPHVGEVDGLHYVAGCNGSGLVMMSYLGHQLGLKILGQQDRPLGVDGLIFPAIPAYDGKPWFLPMVGRYYSFRDYMDRALAGRFS